MNRIKQTDINPQELIQQNEELKKKIAEIEKELSEKDEKIKSPSESDSSNKKSNQSEYLNESVIGVIQKSDIALKVFIFYIFNRLENVDATALGNALKVVKNNYERFGEDFLQTFSTILSKIIVEQNYLFASSSSFKTVIIEKFLTPLVALSSSAHEHVLKIIMELMRAGAIWDNFTAWIDKIFKSGKMDDEAKFQQIYKEIYDFGTIQSKDLDIARFSWHYAPNMLKFLDIPVPPTPPPAPIVPSPTTLMQPSPNPLNVNMNMMQWNMKPMDGNAMNPLMKSPVSPMGMNPAGMGPVMNPMMNGMNPMNNMNPMNSMNNMNGMNGPNNMNKMGGYNRYNNYGNQGYRPRNTGYRPRNRTYPPPHYQNNYYGNNGGGGPGMGKRSYNDMDPGFNQYNNEQMYKNRNINNNNNDNNNMYYN